jgi:hypothetical protein
MYSFFCTLNSKSSMDLFDKKVLYVCADNNTVREPKFKHIIDDIYGNSGKPEDWFIGIDLVDDGNRAINAYFGDLCAYMRRIPRPHYFDVIQFEYCPTLTFGIDIQFVFGRNGAFAVEYLLRPGGVVFLIDSPGVLQIQEPTVLLQTHMAHLFKPRPFTRIPLRNDQTLVGYSRRTSLSPAVPEPPPAAVAGGRTVMQRRLMAGYTAVNTCMCTACKSRRTRRSQKSRRTRRTQKSRRTRRSRK